MRSVNRRKALGTLAGAALGAPFVSRGQARRPNILFVMTDDQRWDAMSCAGNQILRTPNMDRLAAGGVRFTQAFVTNSLCAPSRSCILTGLYTHAHGVITNGDGPDFVNQRGLLPQQKTFPGLLHDAGYFTAVVGKWHIRSMPTGFDHWCILPGQGEYPDPEMIANGVRVRFRGHCEDVVTDQALEALRYRPREKPFCLLLHFKAPHRPWIPAARFEQRYEHVTIPEPGNFNEDLSGRPAAIAKSDLQIADMPDFASRGVAATLPRSERKRLNFQAFVKNYYRVLLGVDENLGRVLDYLDDERLAENTLIIYTGDNGFFMGEHGMFDKRLMYEPSIRVPMLVRYPAGIKPGQVDATHMVLNNDVAPTVLDYAGVAAPSETKGHSRSWKPLLEGRGSGWRDSWLYEYEEYPAVHCAGKCRGVRTSRWKYIHYWEKPEGYELFDLQSDPDEMHNLAGDPRYQDQLPQMQKELDRLRTETGDDRSRDGAAAQPCEIRMNPSGR
jgi:arylsulfatase A-like enzyme